MTALRILVLTSSTGGGHNARAYALRDWTLNLYGDAVEVRVVHLLEVSSQLSRFGVNLYNWIQKKAPALHNIYWCFLEIYGEITHRMPWFGDNYFKGLLKEFRPHLVFSVHDFLNRGYFEVARKTLGAEKVRVATYCGEFSGGFGYSRNWVDTNADLFYARTDVAREYALKLGVPEKRCRLFGNFLDPNFFKEDMTSVERDRFLSQELGLDQEKFTVFLATGKRGANNHLRLLDELTIQTTNIQAIVICGKDRRTYEKLADWKRLHADFKLHIEGFSSRVHQFLQVSQAVFTRGGANLSAEALYYGCPLLFDCTSAVMPQERLTIKYFVNRGAAVKISSARQFSTIIKRWSNRPQEYLDVIANMKSLQPTDHPRQLIDEVVILAREAAEAC